MLELTGREAEALPGLREALALAREKGYAAAERRAAARLEVLTGRATV